MTLKKTEKEKEVKVNKKTKPAEPKRILYELVKESKVSEHRIIRGLSVANLLKQYEEEETAYGKVDIKPTITESEFKKIIEKYI